MKNPGVYAQSRAIFDHPMFKDEPFTEREAWSWMCGAAAFKPMTVRVAGQMIDLDRGQLAFSQRFLQERFQWSRQRVRGFIAKLELHESITQIPTKGVTKITLCNYDKYAFGQPSEQPQNNQATTRQRPKEEELKELLHDDGGDAILRKRATALAGRIESLCGYSDPKNIPPGFCGGPLLVEKWLRGGWRPEIIIPAVQEALAKKRDGPPESPAYFEKPIAKAHARHATPLPEVKPGVKHEITGRSSGPAAGWQAARDDFRAARADLKRAIAEGEGEERSEGGGQVIRLAAPTGRG